MSSIPSDRKTAGSSTPRKNKWKNPPVTTLEELCVGSIVWLALKENEHKDLYCVHDQHCGGEMVNNRAYAHPMLVIKILQRPGSSVPGDWVRDCLEVC